MSHKRRLGVKKDLKNLETKLSFRKPYQLLLTTNFIKDFNKYKHTFNNLKSFFNCEPKLFVTNCVYKIYKRIRNKEKNTIDIMKHCEVRECKHSVNKNKDGIKDNNNNNKDNNINKININDNSNNGIECIINAIGSKNKYHFILCVNKEDDIETNAPALLINKNLLLIKKQKKASEEVIEDDLEEKVNNDNSGEKIIEDEE